MATDARCEPAEPRAVTILGSTGSIGLSTVSLIEKDPHAYQVLALTARRNIDILADQARRLRPRLAVVADERRYGELKRALAGTSIRVEAGPQGLVEAASLESDWVMAGIVGAAGLAPTLAAVRRGAVVALANKECLVCAGELMLREVSRHGATLLPVDSEHNAIFQLFDFERPGRVEKIVLTASGGPFWTRSKDQMARVTPTEAVAHPTWEMGAKISVDSATMMNKGLELIEADHLFPVDSSQIEIMIHPQSVVHGMVAYRDGSVLAQMAMPDMRIPISYSLAWPDRTTAPAPRLDLAQIGNLTFEHPDTNRFPAISIAREALERGGSAAPTLNAANEVAVHGFLVGRIGFLDIVSVVESTMQRVAHAAIASLDDVFAVDAEARSVAHEAVGVIDSRD